MPLFRGVIQFITRPFIGEQTTAREALQQYQGYSLGSVNGIGGFTVLGQVPALEPAFVTPGPTHKLNDPSATGNDAYGIILAPLQDNRNI